MGAREGIAGRDGTGPRERTLSGGRTEDKAQVRDRTGGGTRPRPVCLPSMCGVESTGETDPAE